MSIFEICALAIAGVVSIGLVKTDSSAYAVILRLAVVLLVFIGILPMFKELIETVRSLGFLEIISNEAVEIIFKVFAVLTIGSFSADICCDNGEGTLGNLASLSSKLIALSISLPLVTAVITVAATFFR